MGIMQRINAITGVSTNNPGLSRINRNRIARQMVDRLRAANPGKRNIGVTPIILGT